MTKAKINLIAAENNDGTIGHRGMIPWYLPEDLAWFKEQTLGKVCIMGRETWESLPKKPLDGRTNIILTSRPEEIELCDVPFVVTASSVEDAIAKAGPVDEIMVIGGSRVYKAFLPLADILTITHVDHDFIGDSMFPIYREEDWDKVYSQKGQCERNGLRYEFAIYYRKENHHGTIR